MSDLAQSADLAAAHALAYTLARKDRQLRLLLSMDDIRDNVDDDNDPRPMLLAILRLLLDTFAAGGGALALLEETSDTIQHLVSEGMDAESAESACYEALERREYVIVTPDQQRAGLRLAVRNLPLGALVIQRPSPPFDEDDLALMRTAARQIDSAILQAHTIWKLMQRTRELDAIFRVDALRDSLRTERELLNGFASLLLEEYKGDIAFVLTLESDGIASATVRDDLGDAVAALRAETAHIQFPQTISMQPTLMTKDERRAPLHLLAAPFIVSGDRLGAVIVGRVTAFSIPEHRLLYAMTSQMDSAVMHLRLLERLAKIERQLLADTTSEISKLD
jgi:GTP-sensing pleiotropic transcriptional regulator CodY